MVHVHFRRSSHTLALGELPLVVGLLFCAPGDVMLGWVAGAALVLVFTPGRVPVRVAFNLAQLAITAGDRRHRLPRGDRRRRRARPASSGSPPTLAVLLAVVVSVLLVSAAMWLSGESIEPRSARPDRRDVDLPSRRSTRASGSRPRPSSRRTRARSSCWSRRCWPSSSPTAPTSPSAARPPTSRSCTRRSGRCRPPPTTRPASPACSRLALENFRGEVAEVCLFPAEGEGDGQRISVGGPRGLEVMQPLDEHVVRELGELMERDAAARLVTPEEAGGALAGHLRRARRQERDARAAARRARHDRDDHGRRPRRPRRRLHGARRSGSSTRSPTRPARRSARTA